MRNCSHCRAEIAPADRIRSRWTSSGFSPWCRGCHSRFSGHVEVRRPAHNATPIPAEFVELHEAAERIGVDVAAVQHQINTGQLKDVPRIRRKGTDGVRTTFVNVPALAAWASSSTTAGMHP